LDIAEYSEASKHNTCLAPCHATTQPPTEEVVAIAELNTTNGFSLYLHVYMVPFELINNTAL